MYRNANLPALHCVYFLIICLATYLLPTVYAHLDIFESWNFWKIPLGALVVYLAAIIIPPDGKVSSYYLHFFMLLLLSPTMVLFASGDRHWDFPAITVLSYLIVVLGSKIPLNLPGRGFISSKAMIVLLLIVALIYFFSLIWLGQLQYLNLDYLRVYEIRREAALAVPPIFGYLGPWVARVVIVVGLALSIERRNWIAFAAFAIGSVGAFAFTAHKEPLAYPLIVAAAYYFARDQRRLTFLLVITVIGSALLAIDAPWFSTSLDQRPGGPVGGLLADLVLRRAILVPSMLNAFYIEFFMGEGVQYWWSSSRITLGLVPMPYDVSPPFKIGAEFFNRVDNSANAGFIGMGVANGGILGVVLYSAALGLMLSFTNAFANRHGTQLSAAFFMTGFLTYAVSADLFTALLTHGLLLTIVAAVLLKPSQSESQEGGASNVLDRAP